jgi:hypothetical protein
VHPSSKLVSLESAANHLPASSVRQFCRPDRCGKRKPYLPTDCATMVAALPGMFF